MTRHAGVFKRFDAQDSILARCLWGIDPASRRRRGKERRKVWAPAAAFTAVWFSLMALFGVRIPRDIVICAMLAHGIVALGLIALRIGYSSGSQQLRGNWQDYSLAGFSPDEALRAYSYNTFRGGVIASAAGFLAIGLFSAPHILDWGRDEEYWLWVLAQLDAAFLLTGGILIDTALWTSDSSRATRALAIGLSLLLSPAGLIVALLEIVDFFDIGSVWNFGRSMIYWILPLTIPTLLLRYWIVRSVWRKAIRRLAEGLE